MEKTQNTENKPVQEIGSPKYFEKAFQIKTGNLLGLIDVMAQQSVHVRVTSQKPVDAKELDRHLGDLAEARYMLLRLSMKLQEIVLRGKDFILEEYR